MLNIKTDNNNLLKIKTNLLLFDIYLEERDEEKAFDACKNSMKLLNKSETPEIVCELLFKCGLILEARNNTSKAIEAYEKALKLIKRLNSGYISYDGVEVLRRNIFKSGDVSVVIEKNGSRYSVAKDSKGNFKWSNMMNESSNGETMIFARKANGSGAIVKRNSAGEIIYRDAFSLENQLPIPSTNIGSYDFTPPIDKNIL